MDYLARRNAVLARHKVLASVSGSGWHKNDAAERSRISHGDSALCDRLIAIQDDDHVFIVGDCVKTLLAGLKEYMQKNDYASMYDASLADKHAYKCAKRTLESPASDQLSFHSQDWNGCLRALHSVGVHAVIADANNPAEGEDTPPETGKPSLK